MLFRLACALAGCLIVDLLSGPAKAQTAGPLIPQGPKLLGAGAIFTGNGVASQGRSIALSADGNTAIVGGDSDNNSTGATWVFVRSNGAWSQQQKLTTDDVVTQFGISVGVSGDGNRAPLITAASRRRPSEFVGSGVIEAGCKTIILNSAVSCV